MKNWGGNYEFEATTAHRPTSVDELQAIVADATALRAVGSRHSFTDIADHDAVVLLDGLPPSVDLAFDGASVTVSGGATYADVGPALERGGAGLGVMASLPHITVAGAITTATHGSGVGLGNLATAVTGLEFVTADGSLRTIDASDPDFSTVVVGLGAFGIITAVTLATEPHYEVAQRVFERPSWDALLDDLAGVMASAHSVSVFTRWHEVDQIWCKQRTTEAPITSLLDATPATERRHPILDQPARACTEQLGLAGPWWDRLPHFRADDEPSAGAEIQSEYHVPLDCGTEAVQAMRGIADQLHPALMVGEIRVVAADELLMSPQFGQDTLSFHFTWHPHSTGALAAARAIESALAPFAPRAHWGKLFERSGLDDDRRTRFGEVAQRWDPDGVFANPWLDRQLQRPD